MRKSTKEPRNDSREKFEFMAWRQGGTKRATSRRMAGPQEKAVEEKCRGGSISNGRAEHQMLPEAKRRRNKKRSWDLGAEKWSANVKGASSVE